VILFLNKKTRCLVLTLSWILILHPLILVEASNEDGYFIEISNPYSETINSIKWMPNGSFAILIINNSLLLGYDGSIFTKLNINTTGRLDDISWNSNSNRLLIVGIYIVEYDFVNSTKVYENYTCASYQAAVAWRPNSDEALIVLGGELLKYHNGNLSTLCFVDNPDSVDIGWKSDGSSAIVALGSTLINYTENNTMVKSYFFSSSYMSGPVNVTENRRFVFRSVRWIHNNTEAIFVGEIQTRTIPQGSPDPIEYGFHVEPYMEKGVDENIDVTKNIAAETILLSNLTDGVLHMLDWNDKNGGLIIGTFYTPYYYPNSYYLQIYRLDTEGKLSVLKNDTRSPSSVLRPPSSILSWRPNTSTALITLGDKILFYGCENSSIIDKAYPDTNSTILEYQPQTFSVTPIGPTVIPPIIEWFVDGNHVSNSTDYTFISNYISAGIYNITVNVSIGNISTSRSWNLTVLNLNRPPEITNYSVPANRTLNEGENFTFNISAIDFDEQNLTYSWYLDDVPISNTSSYTLQTDYTSTGIHNVTVVISDGESNTTKSWLLNVTNVNLVPTAYISSISPNPANKSEEITFIGYGNDTDGTIIAYQWRTNDTILGTNATIKVSNLSLGKHTIYFKVQDNDGDWSDEVSATIEVTEKAEGKWFIPYPTFNIIVINILIISALVELIRRKK
jgi:hypothetical protein